MIMFAYNNPHVSPFETMRRKRDVRIDIVYRIKSKRKYKKIKVQGLYGLQVP